MSNKIPERDWHSMVVVGRVARAHGRRGEVVVNPETDFPERRFAQGSILYAEAQVGLREFKIEAVRFQGGRPVLVFQGVESMSQAETLAGYELRIPGSEQHALPEDVYYTNELVGCEVRTVDGDAVGTVVEVQGVAGASRLLVRNPDGRDDVDIPLAEPICVRVDTVERVVVIDPPVGLLDVNRRGSR